LTAPLAALFFGLWVYSKNKLSNWYYLLLFIFALSLSIIAVSQGGVVAIIFSLFLSLILAKKFIKWSWLVGIFVLLALLVIITKIDFNPKLNLASSSLDIRFNQWQETINLLSDNFLLGVGLNAYQSALKYYHQNDWLEIYLYPHNIFLNFWTEMGIFGLIVFLALLVYIFYLLKRIFKFKSYLARPLAMMWATWFVHGLVDVPYFKNDLSILFFVMLGLTFLVANNKKDE
jgi:O-antigen ligase